MSLYPAKSTYVSYDESIMYWPKVISILNGNYLNLADPYIKEYNSIKTHIPFGSEFVIAKILGTIKFSSNFAAILIDLLSIITLFLNIFFLIMIPLAILSVISIYYYPLRIAISSIPFRLLSVIGYLVIIIGLGITISQTFKLYHYKLDLIIIRPYQYLILIFFTFTFSFLALVSY